MGSLITPERAPKCVTASDPKCAITAIPLALYALVGLAYLAARAGQAEQALTLSIYVTCHPASTQEAKDRAEQLCAELETQLTSEELELAKARGRTGSFGVIVAEFLDSSLWVSS